jgi:glycerol-3-phosphate acyltransferase PlsY
MARSNPVFLLTPHSLMTIALLIIGAYLLGSISFAVLTSKLMRLPDPRTFGSKNPGATNVLRSGRKLAAALTLLGDSGKGWLAVFATEQMFGTAVPPIYKMAIVAVAVVIGHMYPVFHGFKGGKGVSTALGVLLALNVWLGLGAIATWIIIAFFFRYSSLAALVAALFAPFFCFLLYGVHPYTAAVIVISLLLIWRHKANIRKLIAGEESKIGGKKGSAEVRDEG